MLEIRPFRDEDWPAIWEMFQEVARCGEAFAYDQHTPETVARRLWVEPPATAFVAEIAHRVVGSYYVRPNQPGRGAHVANAGYVVAPLARGQGIASTLCAHSLTTARDLGYLAMQFNFVVASNEPAVRIWRKHGFEVIGTIPAAFRHETLGLVDALIFHRGLEPPST